MANKIDPKKLKKCRGNRMDVCRECNDKACKDAQRYNCQECCYHHRSCIYRATGMDVEPLISRMGGIDYKWCLQCEDLVDWEMHVCTAYGAKDWLDVMRGLK